MRNNSYGGKRPLSTSELLASERRFMEAIQKLEFGRFESIRIEGGELLLDPWPTTVRNVKFGDSEAARPETREPEYELRRQAVDFFHHVRGIQNGEIRRLEIQHGLPFKMEVVQC